MRKLVQLAFGVLKHQQPYQAHWTPAPWPPRRYLLFASKPGTPVRRVSA